MDLFFFIPFTFVSITHYTADFDYLSLSLFYRCLYSCRAFFYKMITLIISRSLSVKQNVNKICAQDNREENTTRKKYGKRYLNFVTQWMNEWVNVYCLVYMRACVYVCAKKRNKEFVQMLVMNGLSFKSENKCSFVLFSRFRGFPSMLFVVGGGDCVCAENANTQALCFCCRQQQQYQNFN